MAYQVPPRWAHGDTDVTHTEMQKYSDAIAAIYAVAGGGKKHWATWANQSDIGVSNPFVLIHRGRWLFFSSNGAIVDPSGVGDTVTISEVDDTWTRYDLDTVDWLAYGQIYHVTGVSWCMEDDDP